jgi:hypothetical protein
VVTLRGMSYETIEAVAREVLAMKAELDERREGDARHAAAFNVRVWIRDEELPPTACIVLLRAALTLAVSSDEDARDDLRLLNVRAAIEAVPSPRGRAMIAEAFAPWLD